MPADHKLSAAFSGRFRIEREIGRGGMATVYLAQDVISPRKVAIKVLEPDLAQALGADRFLREIEIAATLHHPHILPLLDSGNLDGTLYYVMPFVEGESLQDRLRREKQLPLDDAIGIAVEVADALDYAHGLGVVHRDIKPANILMMSNHAVVADFGIALLARQLDTDRLTGSGIALGTPLYMSPEQAGGAHEVDGRSDIYSLGCVLYELLTGEPPFSGSTPPAILAKKLLAQPTSLRIVRQSVPESIETTTLKALSRSAADRHRTAGDFARELKAGTLESQVRKTRRKPAADAHRTRQHEQKQRTRAQAKPSAISRYVAGTAGFLLLATVIGFLTTAVFDTKLRIPARFTPSRFDFPIIGVKALIPVMADAFMVVVALVIIKTLARLVLTALRRSASLNNRLDRLRQTGSTTLQRTLHTWQPTAMAEAWFIAALVVSAVALTAFLPLVTSLTNSETELLACPSRPLHKNFTLVLTTLIVVLAFSWHHTFRFIAARRLTGTSIVLARWGGLAVILALVLTVTAPWRLLWTTEYERVRMNNERYYILKVVEKNSGALLYNLRTGATEHHRLSDIPTRQRLNSHGYLFEGAREFDIAGGC